MVIIVTVGVLELMEAFHRDRLSNFNGSKEKANPPTFEDSRKALTQAKLWQPESKDFAFCCVTDKDIDQYVERISGDSRVQGLNYLPAVRGLLVAGFDEARGGAFFVVGVEEKMEGGNYTFPVHQ